MKTHGTLILAKEPRHTPTTVTSCPERRVTAGSDSCPAPGSGALRWSAEKPKAAGWWWWEEKHTTPGGRILTSRGVDEVYLCGGRRRQLWVNYGQTSTIVKNHPAGRWAGPLPEPLEASDAETGHIDDASSATAEVRT
jgi:hypothetical protein